MKLFKAIRLYRKLITLRDTIVRSIIVSNPPREDLFNYGEAVSKAISKIEKKFPIYFKIKYFFIRKYPRRLNLKLFAYDLVADPSFSNTKFENSES